jgi:hypothetical protein
MSSNIEYTIITMVMIGFNGRATVLHWDVTTAVISAAWMF